MNSIYQEITDKIIAMMEKGIVPWTKPWVCGGSIVSYATGKPYSLLNRMLLDRPGAYVTFHQVQEAGGRIRKGAKARKIYFYKPTVIETSEEIDGENVVKQKTSFILKAFNVFSFFDTEGLEPRWVHNEIVGKENKPDEKAEQIVSEYLNREGVKLQYKEFDRAFYSPSMDLIQIPPIKNFRSSNGFYSVLFHEMTHSTGNTKRLDRFIQGPQPFGSEDYSKEELVAEMGSAMLLANCGLATETTHTNNAAYIQNWLANIRGNAQLVVNAASKAEKAVNFIMGIKNE